MRLCSIASGSSGNCIYVGSEETHVLVDTGISGKRIEQGLNQLELTGRDIDAILVTHEHSDHISGLGVMARRYHIPVYTTGAAYLHQMLAEVDPKSAEVIHENNTKRVIRALEFYHQNHSPISAHNEEQQERTSPYNLTYFVLNAQRELLYKRIDKRVDEMMTSGLVAEVQKLKDMGYHRGMVSMQGLGYKEILAYLDGEMPLEEAVRILKRDTRHFAKRQLTWFRREPETVWVNKDEFGYDENKMLEYMLSVCHEKGITGE